MHITIKIDQVFFFFAFLIKDYNAIQFPTIHQREREKRKNNKSNSASMEIELKAGINVMISPPC